MTVVTVEKGYQDLFYCRVIELAESFEITYVCVFFYYKKLVYLRFKTIYLLFFTSEYSMVHTFWKVEESQRI